MILVPKEPVECYGFEDLSFEFFEFDVQKLVEDGEE